MITQSIAVIESPRTPLPASFPTAASSATMLFSSKSLPFAVAAAAAKPRPFAVAANFAANFAHRHIGGQRQLAGA